MHIQPKPPASESLTVKSENLCLEQAPEGTQCMRITALELGVTQGKRFV